MGRRLGRKFVSVLLIGCASYIVTMESWVGLLQLGTFLDGEASFAGDGRWRTGRTGDAAIVLELPNIRHYLPYLPSGPDILRPAFRLTRGRSGVQVIMGVPTVIRPVEGYLNHTLLHLINNMNPEERNATLIVVQIGEVDRNIVRKTADIITSLFPEHVESGLIEVISPPPVFYPTFEKLKPTKGDKAARFRWRTKQVLDYAYLMMYARQRGTLYVQLEDDVESKEGYMGKMLDFVRKQQMRHKRWFLLQFCSLGFIGKMLKTTDIIRVVTFFLLFHDAYPVDWLLYHFLRSVMCHPHLHDGKCLQKLGTVWLKHRPSLFQHIGIHSSMRGKLQINTDDTFEQPVLYKGHRNPPAKVNAFSVAREMYSIQRAYSGTNYFWTLPPMKGDKITFRFTPPVRVQRFLFRSGNVDHPDGIFANATIEVLPEMGTAVLPLPRTPDGYYVVGAFKEWTGLASGEVPLEVGIVAVLRLSIKEDADHPAVLSEVHVEEHKAGPAHMAPG